MPDSPTFDPDIVIEQKRAGYVRYRRLSDGRRWEVRGTCDRRGDCVVGWVTPDGTVIRDKAHLIEWMQAQPAQNTRAISEMDVPVTPEFDTCCGSDIFTYTELPRA